MAKSNIRSLCCDSVPENPMGINIREPPQPHTYSCLIPRLRVGFHLLGSMVPGKVAPRRAGGANLPLAGAEHVVPGAMALGAGTG